MREPIEKWLGAGAIVATCLAAACGGSGGSGGGGSGGSDASAGGGTGASASGGTGAGGGQPAGCYALTDGTCVEETFHNPPVLTPDANGIYQLELGPTEFTLDGKRQCGRAYNGLYPGPTIDIAANDGAPRQVRVDLRNRFTKSDVRDLSTGTCTCTDAGTGMSCDPTAGGGAHAHGGGSCTCTTEDGVMCHLFDFNVTNLHFHGGHVRPDFAPGGGCVEADGLRCRSCSGDRDGADRECFLADDVLTRVRPGEGVRHRWDLDEDGVHHEGLDWYHPHIHGTTGIQVASGATGALIVRGPADALPGLANARERVILVMTPSVAFPELPADQPCDEDHLTVNDAATLGDTSAKQLTLINGQHKPRMVMAPGQIERWRILETSYLDEIYLALFHGLDSNCERIDYARGPVPLTQIARDGLIMPRPPGDADWPFAPPYFFMSPGYRIESVLDGSQLADGDTLCLVSARFLQTDETGVTDGATGIMEPPTHETILDRLTNGDVAAVINVTASAGAPTETHLPDFAAVAARAPSLMLQNGTVDALEKCNEVKAITDPAQIQQAAVLWAVFYQNEGYDNCGCHDHNINCRNFETTDRTRYPYDRVLIKNALDHWRLTSGFDGHPFHIHINPYLVCPLPAAGADDRNTKGRLFEPPFAHWRDTYLMNLDRTADLLTEYRSFTGDFVFHCHKLNHEDHGMMEVLHVCDPQVEACDTLCDGRPCGWRTCAEGDTGCQREVAAADCFLDPSRCPEALLRCATCGDGMSCPPNAHCDDVAGPDGQTRCLPGCAVDDDCGPAETCSEGACAPAAPCMPPCGPGRMCVHGACE